MAQQTINIGASPNDGTGTPLRTAFQYTNSNFSELYTALGGGSGLPGASTQVLFNNGTNIAGDAGLVYNSATDALTIGGNVQAASATITGDLTVDTNVLKVDSANNRVGIVTASPTVDLEVGDGTGTRTIKVSGVTNIFDIGLGSLRGGSAYGDVRLWTDRFRIYNNAGTQIIKNINGTNGDETWYDGAGGTRMTLNASGLGVGVSPDRKLHVGSNVYPQLRLVYPGVDTYDIGVTSGGVLALNHTSTTNGLVLNSSGNVGIGVTPSAWNWAGIKALELGYVGNGLLSWASSETYLLSNTYYNSGFKYGTAVGASYYRQLQGVHSWHTNSNSPSAGGSATFTQAMTLDASGNLILLSSNTPATLTTNGQLTVNATSDTNLRFSYRGSDGVTRVANITLA